MERKTVVVGLGKTGLSCIAYLLSQGRAVSVVDDRQTPPLLEDFNTQFSQVPHHFGSFDTPLLAEATDIIISPGLSLNTPQIQAQIDAGKAVYGDIELLAQALENAPTQVVAITGTNGKSTVTAWITDVLERAGMQVAMGGNFGIPALSLLQKAVPDYLILELSSFQLETTFSLHTEVSAFLNISPDHIDRHGSFAQYCAAKQRIYHFARTAVYNLDDPQTKPYQFSGQMLCFSTTEEADYTRAPQGADQYLFAGGDRLLNVSDMALQSEHDLQNALAVCAIADSLALPRTAIVQSLKNFSGLAHRGECVHTSNDVAWYNNSKATNVGAAVAALNSLRAQCSGEVILIAGGQSKGADLSSLQQATATGVRHVVLMGEDANKIEQVLGSVCPVTLVSDLDAAVACAKGLAKPQDAVLLAPACASFDMFENFEQRGTLFTKAVKALYA